MGIPLAEVEFGTAVTLGGSQLKPFIFALFLPLAFIGCAIFLAYKTEYYIYAILFLISALTSVKRALDTFRKPAEDVTKTLDESEISHE